MMHYILMGIYLPLLTMLSVANVVIIVLGIFNVNFRYPFGWMILSGVVSVPALFIDLVMEALK